MKKKYEFCKKIGIQLITIIFIVLFISTVIVINKKNNLNGVEKADIKKSQTTVPSDYIGIYNQDDFNSISENLSGKYILMNDIDMSGVEGFKPIGKNGSKAFQGIFDGNEHKISNLSIESSEMYVGLFGYTNGATIKNLTLENVSVKGNINGVLYIGALAGDLNSSNIQNIKLIGDNNVIENTGSTTQLYSGGLIGYANSGNINNCDVIVNIKGNPTTNNKYIGGLIGYNEVSGGLSKNSAKGKITNKSTQIVDENIGGLIGYSRRNINTSYSNIDIESNSQGNIGGLIGNFVGYSSSVVEKTYSMGNIKIETESGSSNIGGLIGKTTTASGLIDFKDSYSTTNITANLGETTSTVGGIIGSSEKTAISNTYVAGKVRTTGNNTKVAGIVSENRGDTTINNSYCATEICGVSSYSSDRLLQEMLYKDCYKSWDFTNIWTIDENGGSLPYLRNFDKPSNITKENYDYIKYEGSGTVQDPFVVDTAEKLQNLVNTSGQANYKMTQDIDMSGVEGFKPIGKNGSKAFQGIFDGNEYKISNLSIESSEMYVGLFGYTNGATIKNLTLENVTVKGNVNGALYIGALAGYSNSSNIQNIKLIGDNNVIENTGNTAYLYAGGVVGNIYLGSINSCDVTVSIKGNPTTGSKYIGGIIGYNNANNVFIKSSAKGKIINNSNQVVEENIGGLIGYSRREINTSYSNIDIESNSQGNIGGLIGNFVGYLPVIEKIYSMGNIKIETESGSSNVGGLIGKTTTSRGFLSLRDSYSTTNITANLGETTSTVGGIIGSSETTTISNTYVAGKVNAIGNNVKVGGIIGENKESTVSNSYWSQETFENITNMIGTSKLMQEMLYKNCYENWDFTNIWTIDENGESLPYLRNFDKPNNITKDNYDYVEYEGSGMEQDPFIIKTIQQLEKISYFNDKKYFVIANDIDASELGVVDTIVSKTRRFNGILDGKNYSLKNIHIESDYNYVGIFPQNAGTIKNLKIENLDVKSNYNGAISYVGGLVGYNSGIIEKVEVNGTVQNVGNVTELYMGQIFGYNQSNIKLVHSNGILKNQGNVTNAYIGGIVGGTKGKVVLSYSETNMNLENITNLKAGGISGISNARICNSYNKGNISVNAESAHIGGISGENTGVVINTYSVSDIQTNVTTGDLAGIAAINDGVVLDSYWNINNVQEIENNGEGKTLEELKQQSTFLNWNFDEIWHIDEGIDTPEIRGDTNEDYDYFHDDYWEWHTRTTTSDTAYNGKHIVIDDEAIKFFGYDKTSYKDFLYKNYEYAGEKIFMFAIDESKANYHTLDGAGFIFDAKKVDGLLSGYILLIGSNDISIYRLDNVDVKLFENQSNKRIADYASEVIVSVPKQSANIHNLCIKVSPTNATVIDNGKKVINVGLDYSKHAGEDFGLITSYLEHNCSILSEIQFLEFEMQIKNYRVPIRKINEYGKALKNARFQVKNSNGDIIETGVTNENGMYYIEGLQEGIYTFEEIETPSRYYISNSRVYSFKITADGKILNPETGERISFTIVNSHIKFGVKLVDKKGNGISGAKMGLYDSDGNPVLGEDGQHITITTGPDGSGTFIGMPAGEYIYKQIKPGTGGTTGEKGHKVTLGADGNITYEGNTGGITSGSRVTSVAGATKIKKWKKGTKIPVEGTVIGIYDKDGNAILDDDGNPIRITTDKNGEAGIPALEEGEYQFKEEGVSDGYILDDTMHGFEVDGDGNIVFKDGTDGTIYGDVVTSVAGATKIRKYVTGTTTPVKNAVIGIYDKDGNAILDVDGKPIQMTTDENGELGIPSLEYGEYQYKEIQAPEGYILNDTMYSFSVNGDGSITFNNNTKGIIYNDKKTEEIIKGHVIIQKYETETTVPVKGAKIKLYDMNGNEVKDSEGKIIEITTNEEGKIEFEIEPGTYKYKEIEAPEGYVLNDTMYEFTVDKEGKVTFKDNTNGIIYNDKKAEEIIKGHVIIQKYETGTTIPVKGAKIEIYDAKGSLIQFTTNENGKIEFEVEPGTYKYKEIEAPEGYILSDIMHEFTVDKEGKVTFKDDMNGIIYNDKKAEEIIKGHVIIQKYETGTVIPVKGAKIEIYDAEGNKTQLITNEEGKIEFEAEPGTYQYKEIEAPDGYVLNDKMYEFTVDKEGKVIFKYDTNGIIYNDKKAEEIIKRYVIIQKYETGTTIPVRGAKIEIYDSEGNKVQLITNEEGKIEFEVKPGTYKYKEIEAPDGYILNDTMYEFTVDQEGKITFKDGTDGIIYNDKKIEEIIKGHVIIHKYETGTTIPVGGAKIVLYDAEGNIVQLTTDTEGKIEFEIKPGTYKYKEIEAPDGYVLNDTMYEFTVDQEGKVTFKDDTNGIIYNDKKKIVIPTEKNDNEIITNKPTNNVNANIKEGSYPHAGKYTATTVIVIVAIISCYFGIAYVKKVEN